MLVGAEAEVYWYHQFLPTCFTKMTEYDLKNQLKSTYFDVLKKHGQKNHHFSIQYGSFFFSKSNFYFLFYCTKNLIYKSPVAKVYQRQGYNFISIAKV